MLSRKYYIMLARVIKDNRIYSNNSTRKIIKMDSFINDLSNELKKDNINFNYSKFERACNK
jgi:hypothetical protein